jgi:hypothetical protein
MRSADEWGANRRIEHPGGMGGTLIVERNGSGKAQVVVRAGAGRPHAS